MVLELSTRPVMSRFWRGVRQEHNLVASRLAGANARYHSRSPFWFPMAVRKDRHRADTCAWSGTGASAEPTPAAPNIGTVPNAPVGKSNLDLTRQFPPAPFAAALRFTDYAGCSRSFRRSKNVETVRRLRARRIRKAARLRPAKAQHYGARLCLSPRTKH